MTQVSQNQQVNSRTKEGRIIKLKAKHQAMIEIYGFNHNKCIQLRVQIGLIK